MNAQELWKVRLVSFGWSCLSFFATGLVTMLASDDFRALIENNFGGSVFGTLLVLLVTELVKHLRNTQLLKSYQVGGRYDEKPVII